jgi:hypothetical protein
MARRKATLGQTITDFALELGVGLARETLARQFPELAKFLNAGDNYLLDSAIKASDKRRTKRKQKAPGEVRVGKGVYYTPPPNRR